MCPLLLNLYLRNLIQRHRFKYPLYENKYKFSMLAPNSFAEAPVVYFQMFLDCIALFEIEQV